MAYAADKANDYYSQIPGQTKPYTQPYFDAGVNQLPTLQDQYNKTMTDPGGRFNEIGDSFHNSPGFKFALEQAMQVHRNMMNQQGMAGTPMDEQQGMGIAEGLANQDYYNYMNGATGLYNQGMNGAQNMANQGQQAGQSQADTNAQTLGQQGNLAFEQERLKHQKKQDLINNLIKGAGAAFSWGK